jgi:hypothetical protein
VAGLETLQNKNKYIQKVQTLKNPSRANLDFFTKSFDVSAMEKDFSLVDPKFTSPIQNELPKVKPGSSR